MLTKYNNLCYKYTVFNDNPTTTYTDIVVNGQTLKYDPKPCYLGLCLSNTKSDLNSTMITKATRAAYGLRNMLDNTASATTINNLFSQLIEPILLYGAEQWLPYYHPRKVHQHGPKGTFTTPPTQLPTEQVWKDLIYAHYSLHSSTATLAVRAELGAFPTYIPGICRVSNYLAYLCDPTCPPCGQSRHS